MKCELASNSACSLYRRAVVQAWFEGARGPDRRGILPKISAKMPLRSVPRAYGSPCYMDWKLL